MMGNNQPALLTALEGRRPKRLPVRFMHQAERSLSEHRSAKQGVAILDACLNPRLAAEITCQPVRRHGMNATVFFSDIMVPLALAGVEVAITAGVGPVFEQPVDSITEVNRLVERQILNASAMEKAMALAVVELGEDTSVIGFAGAPFTLTTYLVEGRGSRDHLGAQIFMHAEPAAQDRLLSWCADLSGGSLHVRVVAGAWAAQLSGSWVGTFCLASYTTRVAPCSRRALESISVPRIHFGTGTEHLLEAMAEYGSETIGIDHRTPLDETARRLPGKVLQGNINPTRLTAGWGNLTTCTRDVVE